MEKDSDKKVTKLQVIENNVVKLPKRNSPSKLLKHFRKYELERVLIMGISKDGSKILMATSEPNASIVNTDLDIFKHYVLQQILEDME